MAVDTPAKRFSMMNAVNRTLAPMFEVDGAVDTDDRSHLLLLYGGIALSGPGGIFTLPLLPHWMRGGFNRMSGGFSE